MADCPACGKRHVVHWPENWVWRRGERYFCSESCMQAYDWQEYKKRVGWIDDYCRRKKKVKRITLEQKKKAVEIALKGGTAPLKYLEECGSANPSAAWFYIRKVLKEKDPATYAALMKLQEEKTMANEPKIDITIRSEDLPAEEKPDLAEELAVTVNGEQVGTMPSDMIRSAVENVEQIRKDLEDAGAEPRPLRYEGFDVVTIKNAYGQFHYDRKFNILDWTSPEGEEVSYSPECWKTFATEVLPKAMAILGVKN